MAAKKPVRATASASGPAYVAHRYASAMVDVSIMTMNKTLDYVMLYHMCYINAISDSRTTWVDIILVLNRIGRRRIDIDTMSITVAMLSGVNDHNVSQIQFINVAEIPLCCSNCILQFLIIIKL